MKSSEAKKVEGWIRRQFRRRWPGLESVSHDERDGSYYFAIRHRSRDLWLVVELRAYRSLSFDELVEFLNSRRWLDRIRADSCLQVDLPGIHPALGVAPGLIG